MMLEDNNKNNEATKMINRSCKIHVQECGRLMDMNKAQNSRLCIEFQNLCYSVCRGKGNKKQILSNITGHFMPGKVTTIIGPSGAGKTTLLKIIAGERLLNVKGTIAINGIENNTGIYRKQMCYVPQQFALLPFLTTKETLYIAARLKLDATENERTAYLIVNEIAENLGLSDCLNTMANKLSGGERKRLSIAMEVITKPAVLLLDEPTSGLDSVASNQLIGMLHSMARANCTVVCAIHQPSSKMISQFDDIMVLNQGKCMYCGPKDKILDTFSRAGFVCPQFYNIAEFVLEVITEQRTEDLDNLCKIGHDEYESSRSCNEQFKNGSNLLAVSEYTVEKEDSDELQQRTKQQLSTWQQQKILFLRALICIRRDSTLTKLRLLAHVIVAILLGIVFYDFGDDARKVNSNIACLFFLLLFLFFANSMPAVQMFPTEAAVFLQEHINNWYHLRSYYTVKILTDLPMQILCPSCFFIISYYMTGQPMECNRILQAWGICVLITILGQAVGILTGAAFDTQLGTFLIPALSIPLMLFAGFFLKLGEMAIYLQPLGAVSFFRYTFEGLMQAIYMNRDNLTCPDIYCYLRSPSAILSLMDMPSISFHIILIIIVFWILCLHIIIYAVLCWKIYYAKK